MPKRYLRLLAALCVLVLCLVALSTLIASIQVVDRDGDGLRDSLEKQVGTNPLITDTDSDAFPDGAEYAYWMNRSATEHREELAPTGDVDRDGIPNILDYDSDNDGLSDGKEIQLGTDPANPDTDHDGLKDGDEILRGTDPLNPDTNGNGILDGDEQAGQTGGTHLYGADQQVPHTPLRNGKGGSPMCTAIFNPSLQNGDRLKRWYACDAITENYSTYVAHPEMTPLELSDQSYELQFRGEIPLGDPSTQPILIPSVSPTANIISYSSSVHDVSFHFFKDGADNYYVTASRHTGISQVQLTIVTTANSSYFHPYDYADSIPETLTLDEIPESVKQTPPASVCEKAALIVGDLGLTGETKVKKIVTTMVTYFSSFTEGDIPTEAQEPDVYLAIARAHHGACYVRSFAFFVTANALGIPTRLVSNDCHAFVEINIPSVGWEMIDLGGLGGCSFCNPNGYDVMDFGGSSSINGTSGGSSGGGAGEGGGGNSTEGQLPLIVTLTHMSSTADKNGTFVVDGLVTDAQHNGVSTINVEVLLNHTKKEQGVVTGSGWTGDDGTFSIVCTVPGGTLVGENQVVAHAKGTIQYRGAWTDPSITVYTNTTIALTVPASIGLGESLLVRGNLSDIGGLPIQGAAVSISWNGSRIGQATTDARGLFNLTYLPSSPLGLYAVAVSYSGDQYRRGTQAQTQVTVKDKGTRLQMNVAPDVVERNHSVFIRGTLSSSTNESIGVAELSITCNGARIENVSTQGNGSFDTTWTVPRTIAPSYITLAARYPGTEFYAEAVDEFTVCVQSKTTLALLSPTKTTVSQNTNLVIRGTVMDDQGQPVKSIGVALSSPSLHQNVTTDEHGLFNTSLFIPSSFSAGTTSVRIACTGTPVYLASQMQMEVTVAGAGPSSLLIVLLLAIAGAVLLSLVLLRRRRNRRKHFEIQRSLEDIITEALSSLQTGSDHRKTVVDCYQKMCDLLIQKGVIKDASQTPREFALVAKAYLRVPPENLYEFTKVFEKARYSSREINETDREKAIRCLRNIVFAPVQGRRPRKTRGVSG